MKVELTKTTCKVIREKNDCKIYGISNAAGESRLLYHVKNILNKQGHDFIKKRMHKDGHLVNDMQQYLRERKESNGKMLAIYNSQWGITGAEEAFNNGIVTLTVMDIGKEKTN